jgi:outer membrane protein assembly factor BamB
VAVVLLFLLSASALPPRDVRPGDGRSAGLVLAGSITVTPGGNYATYLGNVERTSNSSSEQLINVTDAASLRPLWTVATGSSIDSQPVVENGTVYVGLSNGSEIALNTTTGALLWSAFLGPNSNDTACGDGPLGVTSTATYSGGTLYVDGESPDLFALNPATGTTKWHVAIGGPGARGFYDWSSPLVYNSQVYVGIASNCGLPLVPAGIEEISVKNHTETNYFNTSAPALNGSSIAGAASVNPASNLLYVETGNPYAGTTNFSDSFLAFNATTLVPTGHWQLPTSKGPPDGNVGITPTVFQPPGGVPMVAGTATDGDLYAFNASSPNGTFAWSEPICCSSGETEDISTAWGGNHLYAITPATLYDGTMYGSTVRALKPLTGKTLWEDGFLQSSYGGYAAPLYANGVLVVPDDGSLLFLNGATGGVLQQYNSSGRFEAPVAVSRGEIFAGSTDGDLVALDVPLTASAAQSSTIGVSPLTDSFSLTVSGGIPPYTYLWQFGSGATNTSTLASVNHTFEQAGIFVVNATVTDAAGTNSTEHLTVRVLPSSGPPPATTHSTTGLFGLPHLVGDALVGGLVLLVLLVVIYLLWKRGKQGAPPPPGRTGRPSRPPAPPTAAPALPPPAAPVPSPPESTVPPTALPASNESDAAIG